MSRHMRASFLLTIVGPAVLISFCGGPLFVADLLKAGFWDAGFSVGIAPWTIALLSAFTFMELLPIGIEGRRSRLGSCAVLAGLASVMIIGLMNAFASWRLAMGEVHPNQSLIVTGIIVGMALSVGYIYLAW